MANSEINETSDGESGQACVELKDQAISGSVITKPPGLVSNLQSLHNDRGEIDILESLSSFNILIK